MNKQTAIRLSAQQRAVVDVVDGAVLVIAGPGSGKTRVLTERVRSLLSNVEGHFRVLALTFTNKAADEMRERLADLGEQRKRAFIGNLHGFCMELLTERGKFVGVDGSPHIFENYKDRRDILVQAIKDDPLLDGEVSEIADPRERAKTIDRWLASIGNIKAHPISCAVVDDELDARVLNAYNAGLRACNAYDFDDLLLLAYRLLTENPKLADFYRRLYRFVCVDEAQDLNEAQYAVICALCGNDYKNVMMVGDPKQSIYGFNTAGPQYMQKFGEDFEAARVELTENYRSSKAVVAAARSLDPKYLVKTQLPIAGVCEVLVGGDEAGEAELIADQLAALYEFGHADVEGDITPDRCAVLARSRFALLRVEETFLDRGIPFYKRLTANHENASDAVEDFHLALRVIANPMDRLHYAALAKRWGANPANGASAAAEAIGRMASETVMPQAAAVVNAVNASVLANGRVDLMTALDILLQYGDSTDDVVRRAVYEDVAVFRQEWDQYLRAEGGSKTIGGFMTSKALGATQRSSRDGVGLLTVHSAKGLEFDVVFVAGMAEGTFPDYRATSRKDLDEEARSAFVAITRSKRLLYFSYPKRKMMPWGDERGQAPSRFLKAAGLA